MSNVPISRAGRDNEMLQLATFFVAGEMFGIDVKDVQEVLMAQEVTPVPLAPAHVVGLTNLRGQILPALDLRTRLGIEPRSEDAERSNLVVKTSEGPVSLVVDEIGDVIELPSNAWRDVPETVSPMQRQFVRQIVTLEGRIMLRLDLARIMEDDGKVGADEASRGADR
jgi:purine-binding chemotaxis protein CheW